MAEIQIRLDWGTQPSDLDSHLAGPDGAGTRFHCFFVNRTPVSFVDLDSDDTTSFGPETITIRRSPAGTGQFVAGLPLLGPQLLDDHVRRVERDGRDLVRDTQGALTMISTYSIANATGSLTNGLWHVVNLTIDANGNVTRADIETLQTGNSKTIL